jgi:PAS domain S-box-containing protein
MSGDDKGNWGNEVASNNKLAEEAFKTSAGNYRLLFENANEAIVVLQDGMIKFFNPQFIKISGYQEPEFRSRQFLEFIYPDDREMVIKYHQHRLRGEDLPQSYVCRAIHKDGRVKWMEVSGVLISWEGKPATLNFLSDVTERKLAEEKLLFQASLLDQVNNAIIATDLQGDIIYWISLLNGYINGRRRRFWERIFRRQ